MCSIEEMCCLCVKTKNAVFNFYDTDFNDLRYVDVLKSLFPDLIVPVCKTSMLICTACSELLNQANDFKEQCINSLEIWKQCIENRDEKSIVVFLNPEQQVSIMEDHNYFETSHSLNNENVEKLLIMAETKKISHSVLASKNEVIRNKKDDDFTCEVCQKKLSSKINLHLHMRRHKNRKRENKPCVLKEKTPDFSHPVWCPKKSAVETGIYFADKVGHFYVCKKCNKQLANFESLQRHILTHADLQLINPARKYNSGEQGNCSSYNVINLEKSIKNEEFQAKLENTKEDKFHAEEEQMRISLQNVAPKQLTGDKSIFGLDNGQVDIFLHNIVASKNLTQDESHSTEEQAEIINRDKSSFNIQINNSSLGNKTVFRRENKPYSASPRERQPDISSSTVVASKSPKLNRLHSEEGELDSFSPPKKEEEFLHSAEGRLDNFSPSKKEEVFLHSSEGRLDNISPSKKEEEFLHSAEGRLDNFSPSKKEEEFLHSSEGRLDNFSPSKTEEEFLHSSEGRFDNFSPSKKEEVFLHSSEGRLDNFSPSKKEEEFLHSAEGRLDNFSPSKKEEEFLHSLEEQVNNTLVQEHSENSDTSCWDNKSRWEYSKEGDILSQSREICSLDNKSCREDSKNISELKLTSVKHDLFEFDASSSSVMDKSATGPKTGTYNSEEFDALPKCLLDKSDDLENSSKTGLDSFTSTNETIDEVTNEDINESINEMENFSSFKKAETEGPLMKKAEKLKKGHLYEVRNEDTIDEVDFSSFKKPETEGPHILSWRKGRESKTGHFYEVVSEATDETINEAGGSTSCMKIDVEGPHVSPGKTKVILKGRHLYEDINKAIVSEDLEETEDFSNITKTEVEEPQMSSRKKRGSLKRGHFYEVINETTDENINEAGGFSSCMKIDVEVPRVSPGKTKVILKGRHLCEDINESLEETEDFSNIKTEVEGPQKSSRKKPGNLKMGHFYEVINEATDETINEAKDFSSCMKIDVEGPHVSPGKTKVILKGRHLYEDINKAIVSEGLEETEDFSNIKTEVEESQKSSRKKRGNLKRGHFYEDTNKARDEDEAQDSKIFKEREIDGQLMSSGKKGRKSKKGRLYTCEKCGQVLSSSYSLERHILLRHSPTFTNNRNGSIPSNSESGLVVETVTYLVDPKENLYICKICNNQFASKSSLQRHLVRHSGVKRFMCTTCGKTLFTQGELRSHMVSHQEDNPFPCSICQKAFKNRNRLNSHMKTHSEDKPHMCDICGKKFLNSGRLDRHKDVHSETKQYQCPLCKKSFKTDSSLRIHNYIHLNRTFQCDICQVSFPTYWMFDKHKQRVHKGKKISKDRRFPCETCGKKFALKSTLNAHIRTHTGERPYECVICQRKFTQSGALATHMRLLHSEKRTLTCHLCGKGFNKSIQFSNHMRKQHDQLK